MGTLLIVALAVLGTIVVVNLGTSDLGQAVTGLGVVWGLAIAFVGMIVTAAVIATLIRWLFP